MKPLLAGTLKNLSDIRFPVIASPKLDGIRCLVINGVAYSRTLKPIPNKNVQALLKKHKDTDGELIIGKPTDPLAFRTTTSIVMAHEKDLPKDFSYYIFDSFTNPDDPYTARMKKNTLESRFIETVEELEAYEEELVAAGYEGVMVRDPDGRYKFGRSTVREGILLKFKRFEDGEGVIVGYERRKENTNAKVAGPVGSKRSTHASGMVFHDTIGSLSLMFNGEPLSVGSGLDDAERARLWKIRKTLPGKLVKFKYQKAPGIPRFPIYLGIRDPRDV